MIDNLLIIAIIFYGMFIDRLLIYLYKKIQRS